jgi:poly(A) polymerase
VINTEINSFIEKINKNKIRVNQKNIKYHTISVFLDNDEFQITSLRKDLKTYGRSADVNFVDSVYIDAKRRDFTINALYLDYEGNLIDPYNGYQDVINKNLKFVGNPIERIKEDYLRIFRYCRFFGRFSKFNNLQNSYNEVIKLVNNIKILSNKRVKDEFLKILLEKNLDISLSKMKDLELDKYIFVDIKNSPEIKIHSGFKINSFVRIKYIKSLVIDIIKHEKLDLICVLIPHLYNIQRIEIIANRFELSKQKIKYLNFVKQIQNHNLSIDQKYLRTISSKKKEIKILQLIWDLRVNFNFKNKSLFKNDRIPFNWYKLALFHILPIEILNKLNFFNLEWPSFPLKREEIKFMQPNLGTLEQNDLLYKLEEFWVKHNFKFSKQALLNFASKLLRRND